jgi:hypothetical protein
MDSVFSVYCRITEEVKSKDASYLEQDFIVLGNNRHHRTMDITRTIGNSLVGHARVIGTHAGS